MAGNDSNITAFFGGDTSGLEAALGRAESKVGEIGKKLEDRFVGTRDVAHALATALGLNIEHMAESVARFVTGLSEDQEKQMKALLEQSDRVTDKMIKAMRSTLTDEQAYQMALKERESLQAKIAARTEEMGRALELERKYATDILTAAKYRSAYNDAFIDRQKAMNDLAEKETEIAAATGKEKAAQLEAQKKETAELIARNKVADEAATAAMSVSQKISFLQDGIKAGETVIAALKREGVDTSVIEAQLKERQRDLIKAIGEREKENNAAQQKGAEEHMAAMDKLQALQFGRLSTEEQIGKLEKESQEIAGNIDKLREEGVDTTQAQVALMETENKLAEKRAILEKKVTAAIVDQEEALRRAQQAESDFLGDLVSSQYALRRDKRDVEGASDAELRELIRRSQEAIAAIWESEMANANSATVASGHFGAKLAAIPYTADIAAAQAELDQRANFRSAVTMPGGEEAARRAFVGDVLAFDEAFKAATEGLKFPDQVVQSIQRIDNTLRNVFGTR